LLPLSLSLSLFLALFLALDLLLLLGKSRIEPLEHITEPIEHDE
jgi:hypothetical protein